jgi:transglutaminase-like putative cysteine protease
MKKYRVIHSSEYKYAVPAALSLNDACLWARKTPFQTVVSHAFETEPHADYHRDRVDWFGNHWRLYAFERPHKRLEIVSRHTVEVNRGQAWGDGVIGGGDAFLSISPFVRWNEAMTVYGRVSFPEGRPLKEAFSDLTRRLFRDFAYDPKATQISTPVEEFFRLRRGVCQDFTHLMLSILRSLGIPARYVSGYLNTLPPPGKEKVFGADASHAWVAALDPEAGWVDLDPTNGVVVADDHITLAWGRDYGDVTPLKGVVLGGGPQTLDVKVSVIAEK